MEFVILFYFFFSRGICWDFSLSLSLLLNCSCAVWRLCDPMPGKAERVYQRKGMAYRARRTLAVSWFKSIVLAMFVIPETKRTIQATCLALLLVGKGSYWLISSSKVDVHKWRNQVRVLDRRCVSEAILDESCRRGERYGREKGKTIYLLVPCCGKHRSPWNGWRQTFVSSPMLSACLWFESMI